MISLNKDKKTSIGDISVGRGREIIKCCLLDWKVNESDTTPTATTNFKYA